MGMNGITAGTIVTHVARRTEVDVDKLLGVLRYADICRARHMAMWIIRRNTSLSLPQIGAIFNRDHTSVIHALRKVESAPKLLLASKVVEDAYLMEIGAPERDERAGRPMPIDKMPPIEGVA